MFPRVFSRPVAAGVPFILKNGNCPKGSEITSLAACSAAARLLHLSDTIATPDEHELYYDSDYDTYYVRHDPPDCYYERGELKLNEQGGNRGPCSDFDQCLCGASYDALVGW